MQETADRLGVPRTRVKQLERTGRLLTVGIDNSSLVPRRLLEAAPPEDREEFPAGMRPLWNLRGTVTLLQDAGYSSEEALLWLWRPNEELGATPIEALEEGRHHQVNRIAATLGF